MLDRNKCVQEAACSAFAGLQKTAKHLLVPELPAIFECFAKALSMYQAKNMTILYDAIGTLAHMLGPAIVEAYPKHYSQVLLEPFFLRWQELQPGSYQTAALCECMGFVAQAIGLEILPMAPMLVEKCTLMMQSNIQRVQDPQGERVTTVVLECCLDLLSYLADKLGQSFVPVVQQHNFLPLVEICCTEPSLATYMTAKQSAFALVGDLAVHCTPLLMPHLDKIIPVLATHLSVNMWAVSSNASWALGQLVEQVGPEVMSPYAGFIAQQLCRIVVQDFGNISLRQNACITLGRFADACPTQLAEYLPEVLGSWCRIMAKFQAEGEKIKSFKGLMKALVLNPATAQKHKAALTLCINSFYHDETMPMPPGSQRKPRVHPDIAEMLQNLVQWLSTIPDYPGRSR